MNARIPDDCLIINDEVGVDECKQNVADLSQAMPLCDQAQLEAEADSWGRIWRENCEYTARFEDLSELPPLAPVRVRDIESAVLSFPPTRSPQSSALRSATIRHR